MTWHVLTRRVDPRSTFAAASKAFGDLEERFGACVGWFVSNSGSVYGTMAKWENNKAELN